MKLSVPDYILEINPYKPGKPIEELEREYNIKDSIKLASNENPLGPSLLAVKAVEQTVFKLNRYPDGSGYELIKKIAEHLKVKPENVVLGNGSDEIISLLAKTFLKTGDQVIIPSPSFLMYEIMVQSVGGVPVFVPLKSFSIDLEGIKKQITPKTRMIFICNPNNPTGSIITHKEFNDFMDSIPKQVLVVVDEAYIEFVRNQDCAHTIDMLNPETPLVTLRTFSKAYGLAGLRIGYGIMPAKIAEIINRIRLPFNANSLAQAGAIAALEDSRFLNKTLDVIHTGLDFMFESLDQLNIEYVPSQANFFMINVKKNADSVFEDMLRQGVIVRSMKSYQYPNYIRVSVGLKQENIRFLKAIEKVIIF